MVGVDIIYAMHCGVGIDVTMLGNMRHDLIFERHSNTMPRQ